ncbi:MAG: methyltransferase [Planctomycetes bacterium]|nr:methyltransferase [Planctomycetota bacterium]MCH9724623.1 methyltransferase [Planctomycetota bacterium]MCH9777912.1 methyltransferase [Planctomycetota bacterium]MCH9792599.1 methyltransferase [Planctomycetota bacterium]
MSRSSKKKQRSKKQSPPAEQMLLEFLTPEWKSTQTLCFQSNLQPLMTALVQRDSQDSRVNCFSFDKTVANRIQRKCNLLQEEHSISTEWNILCEDEFPKGDYDAVLLPFSQQFSDEYIRDLTLSAIQSLKIGGSLTIASPRTKDYEYHKFLKSLFKKVTRIVSDAGIIYQAKKHKAVLKKKDFVEELAVREGERLLHAYTRPGVFSHRRPNQSARALINLMELSDNTSILNVDCGSGIVAFVAATRCPSATVHAFDSNTRAVKCAEQGIDKNQITNISVVLNEAGEEIAPDSYDYILSNKSYFSSEGQGEIFLQTCLRALKPGGLLQFTTKQYQWYANRMLDLFTDVAIDGAVHHFMLSARKPANSISDESVVSWNSQTDS